MKKLLLAIILTIAPAAYAGGLTSESAKQAGFDELTDAQKTEVLSFIAKSKPKADAVPTPAAVAAAVSTPAKVNEWLDTGTKIGQMFGGAAKEVGVAVNDFVKTPVGQWTMAIIVWKYMGGVIVHVAGGALVLIVGMGMILFVMRKAGGMEIEYDTERKSWRGEPLVRSKKRVPLNGDDIAGYLCATALVLAISLVCIFSY